MHANMAVHNEADANEPIEKRHGQARGDEGGCGEQNKASTKEVLEGPMVQTM